MKHVTIKDIARSLCISVSTVSRALADDKNIRKETRDMVVEEAKRLGYKRNPVAMNLKMGRTNTIGVIVPEMHTPYASLVINGIQEVLYKRNQKVMIAESDEKPERELENLKMMEQFMVPGFAVRLAAVRRVLRLRSILMLWCIIAVRGCCSWMAMKDKTLLSLTSSDTTVLSFLGC